VPVTLCPYLVVFPYSKLTVGVALLSLTAPLSVAVVAANAGVATVKLEVRSA